MISDNRTYCPRLWDEIFIDKTGQVYSCCHWKPASIGSIYETPLRELCNNKVIRAFRGESLDGNLACFRGCTLLDKNEIRMEREGSSIDYGELRRIKILFAETCNIHCVMCWQDGRSKESLDYDTLIRNVDLEPFESIEIQGGEPLCIKAAKKFFDYAASKGKKISLLTNGLLVNDEWAERFARHSRFVYFSLNAATKHTHEAVNRGSKWETVLRNIQRVRDARRRCGTDLQIVGHMTLVEHNIAEVPQFLSHARDLGFDRISLGYDACVPGYLKAHPVRALFLRMRVRRMLRQPGGIPVITPQILPLLGLR